MQYNTSNTEVKTTIDQISTAVEAYVHAGWSPIPVKLNEKKPKLKGCTGNIPALTDDETRALWAEVEGQDVNVGIRLPETVIVLDVDEYQDKHGADTLAGLESELGVLPKTLTSTRRGEDSRSRHCFFRVPAGFKWVSALGDGIEILQATHRFAVVSPSEKDGRVYRWYAPDGSRYEGVPRADDPVIADLPPAWIEPLKKDSLKPVNRPGERFIGTSAAEDSVQWIEGVTLGYDAPMGAVFTKMLTGDKLDELKAELSNNGHDTMLGKQRWAIRLAALDGHDGLKAALDTLEGLFVDEVTTPGRSGRRSESCAREEWTEGLIGEVNALRGDHKAATVRLHVEKMPVAIDRSKLTSLGGAREVGAAVEVHEKAIIDAIRYRSSAAAVADLVALQCPELVTVRRKDEEDLILNLDTGSKLTEGDLREVLDGPVAEAVRGFRARLAEDENSEAEEVEDDGKERANEVAKEIGSLFRAGRLTALYQNAANSIRKAGRMLAAEKLDKNGELFGCGDEVLDLALARENPDGDLAVWLRTKEHEDAVTKSMPINGEALRDGMASLVHRRASSVVSQRKTHTEELIEVIFPDAEDRRFAQKLLGYAVSGDSSIDLFMVWYGSGGGGKNSLFKSIGAALGKDYTSQLTVEQFLKGSANRPDPQVTKAWSTPFTLVDEAESGQKIDAAAIKKATGSKTARRLHDNNYVETDSNTIAIATNQVFQFKHDSGVERRLVVLPFNAAEEDIIEVQPPATSKWRERDEEVASMLSWLAEGYVMAMSEGLGKKTFPPNIAEATARFIEAADPSQAFFRKLERTGDPEDFLATAELAEELRKVTGETNVEATPRSLQMRVGRWFKDQSHENDAAQVGKKRGYRGWRLNEGTVLPMARPEEIEEAS